MTSKTEVRELKRSSELIDKQVSLLHNNDKFLNKEFCRMLVKEQDRVRSVERFAIGLDSVWLIAGKAITKTLTLKDASVRLSPDYSNYPLLPQLTTSLIGVGTWMAVGYAFAWNEMLNWFVATEPQLIMGMTLALAATVLLGHSEFINMEGF